MKKYISIIISLFISLSIYSQQNFEPAYVITNQGDSISGFIDYRNWNTNPIVIKFKTSLDTEEVLYSMNKIKSFKVHDELYINAHVDVEISPRSVATLNYNSELKIEKQKVFLLAIVQGKKSLYYLKDELGSEHFYIRSQDKYMLLIYKKYLKRSGYQQYANEIERYKGQLSYYLMDCPNIKTSISRAKYTRESLVGIFEDYYSQCANTKIAIITKTEKSVLSFGIIAGLSSTQVKFDGAPQGLTKSIFSKSTNIYVGGFFEIGFSRSKK